MPEIITLVSGEWNKVASAVTSCFLCKLKGSGAFVYTYRKTGEDAPTYADLEKGLGIFLQGSVIKEITSTSGVDVYIWYIPSENDTGVVRFDPLAGGIINGVLSISKTGIISTTYEDDGRNSGHERVAENVIESLPTGKSYFVFDPTAVTDRVVRLLPLSYKVSEGPIYITFYKGTDYTGSTDVQSYNPNLKTDFVHQATLKAGGTGTDLGDYVSRIASGSESSFFVAGNEESSSSKPITVDNSVKYLLEVDNQSSESVRLGYSFSWFETPV